MAMDKKTVGARKPKQFFGIAEWYGKRFINLATSQRKLFADAKNSAIICPFFEQMPSLGPKSGKLHCNKKGGVCSLRNFHPPLSAGGDITFGPITATCPNRFLEDGTISRHIGTYVLGTPEPLFAKEIAFLMRPKS